jgi:hypothetical protein
MKDGCKSLQVRGERRVTLVTGTRTFYIEVAKITLPASATYRDCVRIYLPFN